MVADDRHAVIGFARPKRLLQVGERDDLARHRPVAREAGKRGLARDLLPLRFRGASLRSAARADQLLGRRLGLSSSRASSTRARSIWRVKVTDWRNSRDGFVGAAAQLAREDRLGLGEAGTDHQLGRGENFGGRGRIVLS